MTELTRRDLLLGASTAAAGSLLTAACGSSPLPGVVGTAAAGTVPAAGASSPAATAPERTAEFVIVGAGLSGLMAARELMAKGHTDILILEARDRVGGRTLNQPVTAPGASAGTVVEVGGQWVGPTQDVVLDLIPKLGLKTFKTYNTGTFTDYRNGMKFTYSGRIPTSDPAGAAEAQVAITMLDMMAADVPLDKPWTAAKAQTYDSQTFQTWIENNARSPGGQALLSLAIQAIFSAEPRDLSLLHVLFYIHSAGSLENLIDTEGGAQDSRIVGGSQRISQQLAAGVGAEKILLNQPVRRIEQDANGVTVKADGVTVRAKRVIVALSPTLAGRMQYSPPLPGLRDQLTQRIPMGTVVKVQCVYPTPFWRAAGSNGQATSDTGPVKVTFDNSPPDASVGVMMGFIEGEDGRKALSMTAAERRAGTIESFVRYFGEGARNPLEYIEKSWSEEEYSRGCYAGYFPPGVWLDYGAALRAPVGRIHWAGTETAEVWNGYFDGALRSGVRAAAEVLA